MQIENENDKRVQKKVTLMANIGNKIILSCGWSLMKVWVELDVGGVGGA